MSEGACLFSAHLIIGSAGPLEGAGPSKAAYLATLPAFLSPLDGLVEAVSDSAVLPRSIRDVAAVAADLYTLLSAFLLGKDSFELLLLLLASPCEIEPAGIFLANGLFARKKLSNLCLLCPEERWHFERVIGRNSSVDLIVSMKGDAGTAGVLATGGEIRGRRRVQVC